MNANKFLLVPALFFIMCCSSGVGSEETAAAASENPDGIVEWLRPETNNYDDDFQIKLKIEEKYIQRSPYGMDQWQIQSINYKTLEPVPEGPSDNPDVMYINFSQYSRDVNDTFYIGRFPLAGLIEPGTGEPRYGLMYHPQKVKVRPELLWKSVYVKPDHRDDFYIRCTPPMGPGSISEVRECGMWMTLFPKKQGTRIYFVDTIVWFNVHRMPDWKKIEAAATKLLKPRITYIIPKIGDNDE